MLRVPVLSKSGKPLMPTKASRARRWLREGKAKVVYNDLEVFVVQLTVDTGEEAQSVALGFDPGKHYTGVGVQSAKATLWMAHLALPFKTVKERMELRRIMRRARRGRRINRKLRYAKRCHRQKRFDNRKQAKLPPSIRANKQLELRVVKELLKLFPVSAIHYELVMADVDRTSGRKSARSGVGFSPVMVGQRQMLKWLSELAPVKTHQGWQKDGNGTSQLRQWLGLEKDKENKSAQTPATHAVDGVTLAAFEFVQWKEWHSAKTKHGNWQGTVQITPAPFVVIRRPPISRRQLHLCVPSIGGQRRKYGGTITRHGFRKADKVIAEKSGRTYIGWCSGDTKTQVSVSDSNWKRLGQFTAKKVQLLQRSTGLIAVPSTGLSNLHARCSTWGFPKWSTRSPIEGVDLTAIPLHPASLRVESHAKTMKTPSTLNRWVTCPKPNPQATLRLFCFHYAGGGAAIFRTWSDSLPQSVEVCAIELPGRGTWLMERPFTRLEPLVPTLASALLPYLDKPFAFFGHSMGGLVSFELTRLLRRDYGLSPVHLFVSGHRAPQVPDPDPPIHTLPEPEFLDELRRYNGTPESVLENAELMQLFLPTLRADFAIIETYVYTPEPVLDCPITAFGGLEDWKASCDDLEAWREQTNADFSLQMFPGDHFFVHSAQPLLLQSLSRTLHHYCQGY